MVSAREFVILGDRSSGTQMLLSALETTGFRLTRRRGGYLAKRGSILSGIVYGAAAGTSSRATFNVDFRVDPDGRLIARVGESPWGATLNGSMSGASSSAIVIQEVADAIEAVLLPAGVVQASSGPSGGTPAPRASTTSMAEGPIAEESPTRRIGRFGLAAALVFAVATAVFVALSVSSESLAAVTLYTRISLGAAITTAMISFWGLWEFPPRTYRARALITTIFWFALLAAMLIVFNRYETMLRN